MIFLIFLFNSPLLQIKDTPERLLASQHQIPVSGPEYIGLSLF